MSTLSRETSALEQIGGDKQMGKTRGEQMMVSAKRVMLIAGVALHTSLHARSFFLDSEVTTTTTADNCLPMMQAVQRAR